MWDYIVKNNLVFTVKFCIPAHDEWNIESPEEIALEVGDILKENMAKAGSFFCTKVEVPASGGVYDYWVH